MEAVLHCYRQELPPSEVRLCFDEGPCQLIDDVLVPLPTQPGKVTKQDYEYERNGTACLLAAYDIDQGQRYVEVRPQRTKLDYAEFIYRLVFEWYPQAERIHLVQDNLNTHRMGSFYERYDAKTAFVMQQKLVFHYTPLHASWLNMIELEFAALAKQCLDRRIATIETLEKEVMAWAQKRNEGRTRIRWLFDKTKAQNKFKRHYLKISPRNSAIFDSNN
jgi:hypothetical protein